MFSLTNTAVVLLLSGILFYKKDLLYKKSKPLLLKCVMKYVKARTKYIWEWRNKTPDMIKYKIDNLLKVDSQMASINSSETLSETIFIEEAIEITKDGKFIVSRLLEIEKLKVLMDIKENDGFIKLNKNQVFKLFGNIEFPWFMKITYLGHSNVEKRVPARKYTVVYKFEDYSPFVFPPYSANKKIMVGFSAPKIKNCTSMTGEYFDITIAKQFAGLECDFYKSSPVENIMKTYIDHDEDIVVSLKKINVVVNNELF